MFLEDAGFDWKVLGPDVQEVDYVAWQADQDAYACSGQKCSAQSILFMHHNWAEAGAPDLCFGLVTLTTRVLDGGGGTLLWLALRLLSQFLLGCTRGLDSLLNLTFSTKVFWSI